MTPVRWIVDLLAGRLGVPVATSPDGAGSATRFVVVRRVGGVSTNRVQDRPMLTLEAYARLEGQSENLLEGVRDIVKWLPAERHEDAMVYGYTEIGGPASMPDPTVPTYVRYSITVELRLKMRR